MLRPRRRTYAVATASVFAALYAILGTIPFSRYVLGQGFLTASKLVAPVGGMLFGPVVGSFSAALGDVVDFAYNGQLSAGVVRLDTLAADLTVVITAGLAYTGRRRAAVSLPILVLAAYSLDPLSVDFVGAVPFFWLPMVSIAVLAGALWLESRKMVNLVNPIFVGAVAFAALMCGQVTGTFVGQNLFVRVYGSYTADTWRTLLTNLVFPAYPVERILYSVGATLISYPVLRSIQRMRRGVSTASG